MQLRGYYSLIPFSVNSHIGDIKYLKHIFKLRSKVSNCSVKLFSVFLGCSRNFHVTYSFKGRNIIYQLNLFLAAPVK